MKEVAKIRVAHAWIRSTNIVHGNSQIITREHTCAETVVLVTEIAERVARDRSQLFTIKTTRNRQWVHANRLGKAFLNCLNSDVCQVREVFPNHDFSPFFDLVEAQIHQGLNPNLLDPSTAEYFNAAVDLLRHSARSKEFQSALGSIERSVRRNSASVLEHLERLFELNGRPLILRFDLHYQRPIVDGSPGTPMGVSAKQINKDLSAFLTHLRRKYPSLLTYALSIESGTIRGTHVLFFWPSMVISSSRTSPLPAHYANIGLRSSQKS